jgi:hypothetical protein
MNIRLNQFKPAVRKEVLLVLSGLMWVGVGILLCSFAYGWLAGYHGTYRLLFAVAGLIAALIIHHFGFLKVVDKNLGRITRMDGKPCVFAFLSLKSYVLVAFMMTLGITLRHSSLPRQYLSVLYIGIGLALILSSIRYFRVLFTDYILVK